MSTGQISVSLEALLVAAVVLMMLALMVVGLFMITLRGRVSDLSSRVSDLGARVSDLGARMVEMSAMFGAHRAECDARQTMNVTIRDLRDELAPFFRQVDAAQLMQQIEQLHAMVRAMAARKGEG